MGIIASSWGSRIDDARKVREALKAEGLSLKVDNVILGQGVQSFVRTLKVPYNDEVLQTVVKCLGSKSSFREYVVAAEKFDSLVASLVSRLVLSKITPHFSILYRLGAVVDDTPCKILEKHEFTLESKLLDVTTKTTPLYSMLAQIIHGLLAANTTFGFTHNDLFASNIMGDTVNEKECYVYTVASEKFVVPLNGTVWKIIDFNHADIWHSYARFMSLHSYDLDAFPRRQIPFENSIKDILLGPVNDVFFLLGHLLFVLNEMEFSTNVYTAKINVYEAREQLQEKAARILQTNDRLDIANDILLEFLKFCVAQLPKMDASDPKVTETFDFKNIYDTSSDDGANFNFVVSRNISIQNPRLFASTRLDDIPVVAEEMLARLSARLCEASREERAAKTKSPERKRVLKKKAAKTKSPQRKRPREEVDSEI